jgi:uncharacterized protein (DUF433 family)
MTYLADRITVDPEQCGGRPCIRGLRVRVTDVLDLLASGLPPEQVVEELPDLELEDVRASLRFASQRFDQPADPSAEDETAYLLQSSANRERLMKALENVAQGQNLVVVDVPDEQKEDFDARATAFREEIEQRLASGPATPLDFSKLKRSIRREVKAREKNSSS